MRADIQYFESKCRLQGEAVLADIECFYEGNPFSGTLVLTNFRLAFVRGEKGGLQSHFIPFENILKISTQVEDIFKLILTVDMGWQQQRFELRGPNFATKKDFVAKLETQLRLHADDNLANHEGEAIHAVNQDGRDVG